MKYICTRVLQSYLLSVFYLFRYIHSKNRAGLTYRLAPNHMTDLSSEEIHQMRGKMYSKGYNGGLDFKYDEKGLRNLPEQMDWRLYGAVSSVKGLFFLSLPVLKTR